MTDTQVKCFLALAEHLNYTKTAQVLGISQSTLSAHIVSLEKSMDMQLFIRNKRVVQLSPQGEVMKNALCEAEIILKKAFEEAGNLLAGSALKIGILEGQNPRFFQKEIWETFHQKHPERVLDIKSFGNSVLLEKLDEGAVDAIFGYHRLLEKRKDLKGIPVFRSPLYLVKRNDESGIQFLENLEQLNQVRFILQEKEKAPIFDTYFKDFCAKMNLSPKNVMRVSNMASVMMNIEMGMGIGFIDELSIIFQTPQFQVEEVEGITIEYDLIYKSSQKRESLRMLIDELRKDR